MLLAFFLAGILLGIRLSYLPLLAPALLVRLKDPGRLKCIVAGTIGILVWLIPLLSITGWNTLIAAAQTQSHGHFSDFGGTVSTHPQLWFRLTKVFESLWADGFGLYWQGRHFITACTAIALIVIVGIASWQTLKKWTIEESSRDNILFFNTVFIGCFIYVAWIFLAQKRHS